MVNDKLSRIDQENRPKYLAKSLVEEPTEIEQRQIETSQIERLMIGSDGVAHLLANQGREFANGVTVLSLAELFEEQSFFRRPVALSQYLSELETTGEVLLDDTSLILLKR